MHSCVQLSAQDYLLPARFSNCGPSPAINLTELATDPPRAQRIWTPPRYLRGPATDPSGLAMGLAHCGPSTVNGDAAQVAIALFGNTQQPVLATGSVMFWRQTDRNRTVGAILNSADQLSAESFQYFVPFTVA